MGRRWNAHVKCNDKYWEADFHDYSTFLDRLKKNLFTFVNDYGAKN